MHLHDWRAMLADNRVRLFAGLDAYDQLRRALADDMRLPWPQHAVTIDPAIWPAGQSIDSLVQHLHATANVRIPQQRAQAESNCASFAAGDALAARFRGKGPLRILGVTSRYTTFLQHSMRDWLAAFDRLGHTTRLIIEHADHEALNNVIYTQASAEFRPDLILLIDHYRAAMSSFPEAIPCVMWVQDQLPSICDAKAGAAQGPRDYCLGFGRLPLSQRYGYPAERFMPAVVGVDEQRFDCRPPTHDELDRHGCDVSFVSHASMPAEVIVAEQCQRMGPDGKRLIADMFERLRSIYEGGGAITQPLLLRRMLNDAMAATCTSVKPASIPGMMEFFNQRVNNALFRHQSLQWLADAGVDLRLYGGGWEKHPRLKRFARGVADNATQLASIYRASRINLQITPHGALHQRLLEGLSAGGFFLIRYVPGDVIENVYRHLHKWCVACEIDSDDQIRARATPQVQQWLTEIAALQGLDPFTHEFRLTDTLRLSADGGYIRSAGAVWPEYDAVAFRSRDELCSRVSHFLAHDDQRRAIAAAMRVPVLERFTYTATSRRLLAFIADDLTRQAAPLEAAA
jgi:hypothetical protein